MNTIDNQILYESFVKQYQSRLLVEAANARLERQLRAVRGQNQSKEQSRTGLEDRLEKAIVLGIAILLFAAGLAVAL